MNAIEALNAKLRRAVGKAIAIQADATDASAVGAAVSTAVEVFRQGDRPFKMTIAKLCLAQAAMGQPASKSANSASAGRRSTAT